MHSSSPLKQDFHAGLLEEISIHLSAFLTAGIPGSENRSDRGKVRVPAGELLTDLATGRNSDRWKVRTYFVLTSEEWSVYCLLDITLRTPESVRRRLERTTSPKILPRG